MPIPSLPLPHDLISLVTNHTFMKEWTRHQNVHETIIWQIDSLVDQWPVAVDDFEYEGNARLHRYTSIIWRNSNWIYTSSQAGPHSDSGSGSRLTIVPRQSIDQELELQKLNQSIK
jgi:hypothetical protein